MSDNENTGSAGAMEAAEDAAAGFGAPKTLPTKPERGNDELTEAVKPVNVTAVAVATPSPAGRYCLDYEYNNQTIHETHATLRKAVARVADLKRMGIVPATSVNG